MPRANLSAIGLGFIGGYADATGYLRWHVFGANMTGNTVLFAITLFQRSADALRSFLPIFAFVCGAMIAAALLLYARPALALMFEAVLLVIAACSDGYVLRLGS